MPRPRTGHAPGEAEQQVRPGDAQAAVLHVVQDPELLELVAQPVVDLQTGNAAGYELLSRVPPAWCVPPDTLFAGAREVGLSAALHARVVSEAMRLRASLPADTFLTVNVDPVDLPDPEVLGLLLDGGSLAGMVIEVTEHAWPADRAPIDAAIERIREHGGLIAADDVGAGYAGLNQLMRLRPDFVKIDRELVQNLGHDPASEALIIAVGQLCGSLDAWVIVEGVETEIQLAALSRLGVPLGQGWLLGRPGPPWPDAESADLVRKRQAMTQLDGAVAALLRQVGEVCTRDEHGVFWRSGENAPCLTIAPSTPVKDAVRRAISRPPGQRWTSVLVTGTRGDVVGEVTMEDLINAAVGPASSAS